MPRTSTSHRSYDDLAAELGCTVREGQRNLVDAGVALTDGDALLVKAPTATGKTLAALMIAGMRHERGAGRTIIATYTKLLQNQYRDKDLAAAQQLFPEVTFAVLKGADNYLCRHSARKVIGRDGQDFAEEEGDPGEVADRLHLWKARANARLCGRGKHTPADCGYMAARARALEADVVITNHAITLVEGHRVSGESMLGEHSLLIVDEIHNYPRAADSFGTDEFDLTDMATELHRKGEFDAAETVRQVSQIIAPGDNHGDRLISYDELRRLAQMQTDIQAVPKPDATTSTLWNWVYSAYTKIKTNRSGKTLATIAQARFRDPRARVLKLAHVDIAPVAAKGLAPEDRAVLMMSATIGTPDRPTYVADQCGIPATVLEVSSALDYPRQMRIGVYPAADAEICEQVQRYVTAAGGGTLVLCRSWAMVNKITEHLSRTVPFTVLSQDRDRPSNNFGIVRQFAADEDSVLVGTASFFEGIDVPGNSLRQVLIARLPMLMSLDPLSSAREQRAGSRYIAEHQIPHTALMLEQMAGRLVRSPVDRGVVAVLDPAALRSWGATAVQHAAASFGMTASTPVSRRTR